MNQIKDYLGSKNLAVIAKIRQLLILEIDWDDYIFYSKMMELCTMSDWNLIDLIITECWRVREWQR